jgi:hypothetical protein
MSDLSDFTWALRSTLYGILASAASDKQQLVMDAIGAFTACPAQAVAQWLAAPGVAKVGRKISAERLARLKEMHAALSQLIKDTEIPPPEPVVEKKEADMPPEGDKHDMDAVLKRLEELEKKAAKADELETQSAELKKQLEGATATLEATSKKLEEAETVAKGERDLRLQQEFIAKAKALGLNPDDDAAVLKNLNEANPEFLGWVEKKVKALNEQVRQGSLFKTAGRDSGAATGADSAEAEVLALAKGIVEKGSAKTIADAMGHVFREHPELYARYRAEASVRAGGNEPE